jgi:hypothetical protein
MGAAMRRPTLFTMFLAVVAFCLLPAGNLQAQRRAGRVYRGGGRHVVITGPHRHVRGSGRGMRRDREFVGGGYYPLGFDDGSQTQIIIPVNASEGKAPAKEVIKEVPPPPPPPNPKMVEVPMARHEKPGKPVPPAVFVLKSGERIEARQYTVTAKDVQFLSENREQRLIPVTSLDIEETESVNRERGLNLLIPVSGNEISLGF